MSSHIDEIVLILDFGSQYTQLIARRIRECGVFCEIHPYNMPVEDIRRLKPRAVILSGGPASVYAEGAPRLDAETLNGFGVPTLGICYGMQLMAQLLKGRVEPGAEREYGPAGIILKDSSDLFYGLGDGGGEAALNVWMSHGDRVADLPPGFRTLAASKNSPHAAFADSEGRFFGVQFHPEVHHTPRGMEILRNFLFRIAGCRGGWTMESFIQRTVRDIRERVGGERVLCALSGGVDSGVLAALVHRAIGDQLQCVLVDNGLLRRGEVDDVRRIFGSHLSLPLHVVDGEREFLGELSGVTDPEEKRKIIGHLFIRLFEREALRLGEFQWLAQGTIYPDVIESTSFKGPSALIKSHHNVGGLPEEMGLKLLEPLRELFKDEVRVLGRELGIPSQQLDRHPFPGPGLAIRIIGEVTHERLEVLRAADYILLEEVRAAGLYNDIWQCFAVLLPVKSVGVMGDERTYENVAALRAVASVDGMTADWYPMPPEVAGRIASRIMNEVRGINRVVYDISSKPPSTIEWE